MVRNRPIRCSLESVRVSGGVSVFATSSPLAGIRRAKYFITTVLVNQKGSRLFVDRDRPRTGFQPAWRPVGGTGLRSEIRANAPGQAQRVLEGLAVAVQDVLVQLVPAGLHPGEGGMPASLGAQGEGGGLEVGVGRGGCFWFGCLAGYFA